MSAIALIMIWLAFVLPLIVAAAGRHRVSTKIGALSALALVLSLSWLFVAGALSDDRNTLTPLQVAAPFAALFLFVALISFRRRPA